MRRIQDAIKAAWAVLWGHSSQQRQMREIRMQWTETLIEIDTMFEKVNALVARLAKRQKRLEVDAEAPPAPALVPSDEGGYDRKAALRDRVATRKGRSSRASAPPNGHQEVGG